MRLLSIECCVHKWLNHSVINLKWYTWTLFGDFWAQNRVFWQFLIVSSKTNTRCYLMVIMGAFFDNDAPFIEPY